MGNIQKEQVCEYFVQFITLQDLPSDLLRCHLGLDFSSLTNPEEVTEKVLAKNPGS